MVCPVKNFQNANILKKLKGFKGKVIFSLEKETILNNELDDIENKEVIRNFLKPSVLNNLATAFEFICEKYPNEYFTIVDIDDNIEDIQKFEKFLNEFISKLKQKGLTFGRFNGPKINNQVINPIPYGYYYSSVFHPSVFKNFPILDFINPIHGDNFIIGYAIEHSNGMLWSSKFFGYEHIKFNSTDSSTITKERLEDTLFMYLLNPFSYNLDCSPIPSLTISIATMESRTEVFRKMISNFPRGFWKIVIQSSSEKIRKIAEEEGIEYRFAEIDNGSFNKINLKESEKKGFVILLDDDFIYDSQIIQKLFKSYLLNGRNCVVCSIARELISDSYQECRKVFRNEDGNISVIGGGGVLYPPNFFSNIPKRDSEVFKTCDDLFFTFIAQTKNIPITMCRFGLKNKQLEVSDSLYKKALSNNFEEYSNAIRTYLKHS